VARTIGRRWRTPTHGGGGALTAEADAVALQRIDEAAGLGRPTGLGTTYAESEYRALGEEQELIWPAEGEATARPSQVRAEGLQTQADAASFLLSGHRSEVSESQTGYQHAVKTLTPYLRRDSSARYRYWAGWVFLGLGDTAGVWGAAISLGEVPLIALGQALATGFATVTAGQAGADLKDLRMARQRQRDPDTLMPDEQRYQRLFVGMEQGISVIRVVLWLSVAIVGLLTMGICTLRLSVEGSVAGLSFGALAAVTALGSFVSAYSYTDEVADLIATTEHRYRKAVRQHCKLAKVCNLQKSAEAREEARSLGAEYSLRGNAASKRIESLSYRVLRRNPQVVGHGQATGDPGVVIGRRSRNGGAS
jgi:hypothetical protein